MNPTTVQVSAATVHHAVLWATQRAVPELPVDPDLPAALLPVGDCSAAEHLVVRAEGMYYWNDRGEKIIDAEAEIGYLHRAFEKMCEDHLYWAGLHARWMIDENFDKGPRRFFDSAPALLRPFIIAMVRRQVRRNLWGHGMGRHTMAEMDQLAARDIDAIADLDRSAGPQGGLGRDADRRAAEFHAGEDGRRPLVSQGEGVVQRLGDQAAPTQGHRRDGRGRGRHVCADVARRRGCDGAVLPWAKAGKAMQPYYEGLRNSLCRAFKQQPETPWREAGYAVVDLETTGLDPKQDEIISFAAVPIDAGRIKLDSGQTVQFRGVEAVQTEAAVQYLTKKLLGKLVILKGDDKELPTGRCISAYVYLKNKIFINAYLIKSGLAVAESKITLTNTATGVRSSRTSASVPVSDS